MLVPLPVFAQGIAIIPIHYEVNLWAMKKNVDFKYRWDQITYVPEMALAE
ncbi:hypothetical protein [Undibacterium sp. TS12]|nr:hypothetical protein [Undibacterium sp. TS12]MCH8620531.1 hypothetical protein [Undibacterium sp. TS12]